MKTKTKKLIVTNYMQNQQNLQKWGLSLEFQIKTITACIFEGVKLVEGGGGQGRGYLAYSVVAKQDLGNFEAFNYSFSHFVLN